MSLLEHWIANRTWAQAREKEAERKGDRERRVEGREVGEGGWKEGREGVSKGKKRGRREGKGPSSSLPI